MAIATHPASQAMHKNLMKIATALIGFIVIAWLVLTTHIPSPPKYQAGTQEWFSYVDQNYFDISDGQGHGPDVGSKEWLDSVQRQAKMQVNENLQDTRRCQLIQNQFEHHTYIINNRLGLVLSLGRNG